MGAVFLLTCTYHCLISESQGNKDNSLSEPLPHLPQSWRCRRKARTRMPMSSDRTINFPFQESYHVSPNYYRDG